MIQLLFIRHGATVGNLEKRYIGSTDEPLCDTGIAQIKALRQYGFQADYLFVSPMLRTRQTAQLLFPQKEYTTVNDFRETDPVPQGESVTDFKARCCSAFEQIMKTIPDHSHVAFVVHGGVIMSIMEAYAEPKKGFYDYHIGNGKYIFCKYDNDISKRCIYTQR